MLGVGLDELAQREAHRRYRRMTIVTAASVAGMLFASALAYTAIQARDEARDQRREADGLVGFMLGDLRAKLEPIGRLDVLDSVGARALAYYEKQDKSDLSDEALAQRSKALTLMGEMAQKRGDMDGALARYREAMQGTAEAVRRDSTDPKRLFDHAQNVFWVGYIDYQRGSLDKASSAFREYRRLADRMIALAPNQPDYRMERIYADTNLGTVLMDQRRFSDAAQTYQNLLTSTEALASANSSNFDYQQQLSESLAWLSEAREYSGQLDDAIALRERQISLLARLWQGHRGDTGLKQAELAARRSLSRLYASRGQIAQAFEQADLANGALAFLSKTEPENMQWVQIGANLKFEQTDLQLAVGKIAAARVSAHAGCDAAQRLAQRDQTVEVWRTAIQKRCFSARARIALRSGDADQALADARQALALSRTERGPADRAISIAAATSLLSEALAASGQREAAAGSLQTALAAWPKDIEEKPSDLALHANLLARAGQPSTAITKRLSAMGYRHPEYLRRGS
jgi:tetratricopeptide (TPR) repeat protein